MSEFKPRISYKKLPGSFWAIVPYFNTNGSKRRLHNYKIMREKSKKQGLNLLVIEVALGKNPFEISSKDADILVQLRTNSYLWHQHRIYTLGLRYLPKDCDKVACLDSDVYFENANWIKDCSRLLEKYRVVQPFSKAVFLSEDNKKISECFGFVHQKITKNKPGYEGYAFCFRRELIEKYGFYDKGIVGYGDDFLWSAAIGKMEELNLFDDCKKMKADYMKWARKFSKEVDNSYYYLDAEIYHLWHGNLKSRLYVHSFEILRSFDPSKHLRQDKSGLWAFAPGMFFMPFMIRLFFIARRDDNHNFWSKSVWKLFYLYLINRRKFHNSRFFSTFKK